MSTKLEDLIRAYIPLSKRPNGRGWWGALCKICGDHGKKGKRAGFRFEDDGVGYNCFNCGHTAMHHIDNTSFSREMTTVLDAFGIPVSERNGVLLSAVVSGTKAQKRSTVQSDIEPKVIKMPEYITPLDPDNGEVDEYAIEYLTGRLVDWKSYPFFIGRETDSPASKKWYARVIIPVYKDKKLIYYLGRDLTDTRSRKYLNVDVSRDCVLYGFDQLDDKDSTSPIYVVEGWFDAYAIQGVAVFGSRMTTQQIAWLNKNPRQKVVIPDKFGDGHLLAEQAISLGWAVSTPDIGACKDVNAAVVKYGLAYTLMTINANTHEGFAASINVDMYCE